MNSLAKNVKTLRQKNGWSQGQIAHRMEISIPAFSKIETGITDINISRLQQLAEIFGVTVYKLLGSTETESHQGQINELNEKLAERETEIIQLQQKLICLYDELIPIRKGRSNG